MERYPSKLESQEESEIKPENTSEIFIEKFQKIKDDLKIMFNIEVTSEASLNYPWVKDEFFEEVKKDMADGKYFALDYMIEEGLLNKKDVLERTNEGLKNSAINILKKYKDGRLKIAKDLFLKSGFLTEEEISNAVA